MEKPQGLTVQLDGTNYTYWSDVMHNHLKGLKFWKYISGKVTGPAENDSKFEAYDAGIGIINSWIANTIDPTIVNNYPNSKVLKKPGIICLGYTRKATQSSGINSNVKSRMLNKGPIVIMISIFI